jgi:quercetin dioxygenase-like cupin family protein
MGEVFRIDPADLDWSPYEGASGRGQIRFKALTQGVQTVTRVQYIEYAPGHSGPVHRHDEGEVFIVTEGELWLDGARNGPGSILCIPRDTDYAVRSGDQGARFFRVVVG